MTFLVFEQAPNVFKQFISFIFCESALSVFCTKYNLIKYLGISTHWFLFFIQPYQGFPIGFSFIHKCTFRSTGCAFGYSYLIPLGFTCLLNALVHIQIINFLYVLAMFKCVSRLLSKILINNKCMFNRYLTVVLLFNLYNDNYLTL